MTVSMSENRKYIAEYDKYLNYNEFEIAFDTLEDATVESMELKGRCECYIQKMQTVIKSKHAGLVKPRTSRCLVRSILSKVRV